MAGKLLTEKYENKIQGVVECYDRILISGNLQPLCYAKGMTKYLYDHDIRIFDYAKFAEPLRELIRANMQAIAQENKISIEFVNHQMRKEERVQEILQERGDEPGLVHILSAMERCPSYQPWHDKDIHKTYLKPKQAKCLHYYVYFIDKDLGLCYLRVPTWCPFRLQIYFNGHHWLASQLQEHGIGFQLCDNAFVQIDDFATANELATQLDITRLHQRLNQLAQQYCPVVTSLGLHYTWSISQAELATDIVFKQPSSLQALYPHLLETLVHTVKPDDIATFLGRKGLHGKYQGEMGTGLNVRLEGRRIKHRMGPATLKMYDKFNRVLRIETTINDVTFFYQYRQVHHRDGTISRKWVPMKKTIYSLPALHQALAAANQRYLKFISEIETPEVGLAKLHRLTETKTQKRHRYKGFNLLAEEDTFLLRLLVRGEFFISGFTNKELRQHLDHKNSGQISRLLKRLRVHGIIKKVAKRYKYYLTSFGRQVVIMALKLREMYIIPSLAFD
jgi:hypothetical protein